MKFDPALTESRVFVTSFRSEIDQVISCVDALSAARKRRPRVIDIAHFVFGKYAYAAHLFAPRTLRPIVEERAAFGLLRRERSEVVEVERRRRRGDPLKRPAHSLLELVDPVLRCAGYTDEGDVALEEVYVETVEGVGDHGTGRTRIGRGTEHEVIYDELTAAIEKVRQ